MDNRKGKGSPQVATPSISSRKTALVVSAASQDLKVGRKRPAPGPAERSLSLGYECTSRIKREDKESGNYQRYTTKEKASSGEPRHTWSGGPRK